MLSTSVIFASSLVGLVASISTTCFLCRMSASRVTPNSFATSFMLVSLTPAARIALLISASFGLVQTVHFLGIGIPQRLLR